MCKQASNLNLLISELAIDLFALHFYLDFLSKHRFRSKQFTESNLIGYVSYSNEALEQ